MCGFVKVGPFAWNGTFGWYLAAWSCSHICQMPFVVEKNGDQMLDVKVPAGQSPGDQLHDELCLERCADVRTGAARRHDLHGDRNRLLERVLRAELRMRDPRSDRGHHLMRTSR